MKTSLALDKADAWPKAFKAAGIYLLVVVAMELASHLFLTSAQTEYIEWILFLSTTILIAFLVQRNFATIWRSNQKQREITKWFSEIAGEEFFPLLARNLARVMKADCALICELTGDGTERLRSLAAICRDRQLEEFECSWIGTPAEEVLRERRLVYLPRGVKVRFALTEMPLELAADSFLGIPIIDASGRAIGLLALLDDHPLLDREGAKEILPFFAVRAAAELERRRSEEALRQNRDRIQAIIATALDAVVEMDDAGMITSWNPQAEAIFGWSAEEATGRKLSEMIIPFEYREAHESGFRHFLATGEGPILNRRIELTALHRDGREFPVELAVTPIQSGKGYTFAAFVRDITERNQAEEALRESEERFRATFNQAAVGIGHVGPDGRWLRVNRKYCDILGYTVEELRALSIVDITHPDDRETTIKHLALLLEGKIGDYSLEKRYIRKNGSIVWVNITVSKVADADGKPRFFVGVVEDITARKQAEEALRFSEARFRALYHDNPAMIFILDTEWKILSANPVCAKHLGYSIEELEGLPALEVFHGDDRQAVVDQLRCCLQNPGRVYRWQFRKIRKDGNMLWVEEIAQGVYDPKGAPNILIVCQDITERKRAQEEIERLNANLMARAAELEDANRELETFNYAVAHDLRKPLTTVNGYCQILQELCSEMLDGQCSNYLKEAYDATWRMNQLIDTLLNFAHLTAVKLHREQVDLSTMAQVVAAELRLIEPERRVTFRLAEGISVIGDASLLRVVLENLLGNAWKYTGTQEEAIIEFGLKQRDGKQVYFVRDNGLGFDMADKDKLFLPFQRLHGTEEFAGHGIGLATVERIIRRHGGRIWAESEPGKGAAFFFTLSADSPSD